MTIDEMLAYRRPMDDWERRADVIGLAYVSVLLLPRYGAPQCDGWQLLLAAANAWDDVHGTLIEMEAE
jgi:hypothetical protein